MVTEQMDDEENRDLRYRIRFVIHHPDIDPDRITKTLD
jgi:predicted RNA polymerase sigma factor